mmetsp:Transcript_5191/g.6779  ORF Transcript_5191/g.6779 Transcript_5191/m.6779 type:complete len:265 (-) Transcript_5191:239-1033(-)
MAPTRKHSRIQKDSQFQRSIEVCQGPDCTGLGGGAALLEIEELVQEDEQGDVIASICSDGTFGSTSSTAVVAGGCRDLCTVGPNVHIRCGKHVLDSFHHVNDASSCRLVVESAGTGHSNGQCTPGSRNPCLENSESDLSSTAVGIKKIKSHSHQSMMARRSDRMRWEALRHISRHIAKCKNNDANSGRDNITEERLGNLKTICAQQFSSATTAEVSAATEESDKERGRRRANRLIQIIDNRLDQCLKKDSSSDGDNVSSDSGSD